MDANEKAWKDGELSFPSIVKLRGVPVDSAPACRIDPLESDQAFVRASPGRGGEAFVVNEGGGASARFSVIPTPIAGGNSGNWAAE
jgi:hypothetical protein